MAEYLLDIEGLEKSFPGVRALKGVQLRIRPGEVHALMGENGAGKSTLIKVLTGIYQKDAGTIRFDGKEINARTPIEANAVGISTIYQELNLVPFQTVYENLFLGRERMRNAIHIDRRQMQTEAERIMHDMGIDIDVTRPLNTFSTAIQQMVAIARAVSIQSRLVIMDEPTSSLDEKEVEVLFGVIRRLQSQGISILFISHKLDEVFTICDRLTVFKDGSYVGDYDVSELDELRLVSLMVGHDTQEQKRESREYTFGDKPEILETRNIRSGMRLNGIGITIKEGEVVGLAGLLGSGRTELARIIFGVDTKDDGEIYWYGQLANIHSPATAIQKGMGFCTEDRKVEGIIPHLSVRENITAALLPQLSRWGFVNTRRQNEIVQTYIDRLQIKTPSADQAICNLSGGNQQKVILARWMCLNPRLMIMDEPTRGIDVGAKAEIEQLIQSFASQGISVLMISSEMAELERNCDRVIVMRDGRKRGELTGNDISQSAMMALIASDEEESGKEADHE